MRDGAAGRPSALAILSRGACALLGSVLSMRPRVCTWRTVGYLRGLRAVCLVDTVV